MDRMGVFARYLAWKPAFRRSRHTRAQHQGYAGPGQLIRAGELLGVCCQPVHAIKISSHCSVCVIAWKDARYEDA